MSVYPWTHCLCLWDAEHGFALPAVLLHATFCSRRWTYATKTAGLLTLTWYLAPSSKVLITSTTAPDLAVAEFVQQLQAESKRNMKLASIEMVVTKRLLV